MVRCALILMGEPRCRMEEASVDRLRWTNDKEPYESEDVIRERFKKYEEDVTTS